MTRASASPSPAFSAILDGALGENLFLAPSIANWQIRLAALARDRQPLLFFSAPADFTACLLACWRLGLAPILLPDKRPATLRRFSGFSLVTEDGIQPIKAEAEIQRESEAKPSGLALELLTSGSTGAAKRVGKTFAQLEKEISALILAFGPAPTSSLAATVTHQHFYGLLFTVLWPLLSNRPVLARRCFFPEELALEWKSDQAFTVLSSPAHARMLADLFREEILKGRQTPLTVYSSGGRLDATAAQSLVAVGAKVVEIYGSTETGGIAWRDSAGSAWRALPGVTWSLREQALWVASPWCDGPENQPYAVGDRAEAVGEGFALLGRLDRIVKVAEKRVSLDEVEAALLRSPWIKQAHCLLLPRLSGWREEVGSLCELTASGEAHLQAVGIAAFHRDLRHGLSDAVEPVAMPRHWRFGALPFNTQGKLQRQDVLAKLDWLHLDGLWAHCTEKSDTQIRAEMWVDPDYARLQGHFPGHPLVPGVCQVLWAQKLIGQAHPDFAAMQGEAVKFHAILRPGNLVRITVTVLPRNRWAFRVDAAEGGGKFASGKLSHV